MKFPARLMVFALSAVAIHAGGVVVAAQDGQPTPAPAQTPAPGPRTEPYVIGRDPITPPRPLSQVSPQYPPEALRARVEGVVGLRAVIERDGTPSNIEVTRSLDTKYGLDAAAVAAFRQWKFEPGRLNGVPVRVLVTVNLVFRVTATPPMKRWPDGFDVEPPAGERTSETAEVASVRLQFTRPTDWTWTVPRNSGPQEGRWIVLRGPDAFDVTIRRPQAAPGNLTWPVPEDVLGRFGESMRRSSPSGDNAQALATGQVDSRSGTFWIWVALRLPTLPLPPGGSPDDIPFSEGRAWVFNHTQDGQALTVSCTQLLPRGAASADTDARIARAAAHCAAVVNSISIATK